MENLRSSIFWYKEVSKTNTDQGDMLNLHFWVWLLKIEFLIFPGFWVEISEDSWLGLEEHLLLFKIMRLGSCLSSFSLRNKPNTIFLFVFFCGIIAKKVLNVKPKRRHEDRKDNQQNRFRGTISRLISSREKLLSSQNHPRPPS